MIIKKYQLFSNGEFMSKQFYDFIIENTTLHELKKNIFNSVEIFGDSIIIDDIQINNLKIKNILVKNLKIKVYEIVKQLITI